MAHDLLPLLPLIDTTVFPQMVVPLLVGRTKSKASVEDATSYDGELLVVSQKNSEELPEEKDLYNVGVIVFVEKITHVPDGTVKILVQGKRRVRIIQHVTGEDSQLATYELLDEVISNAVEAEALVRQIQQQFEKYCTYIPATKISPEFQAQVAEMTDPSALSDLIPPLITALKLPERQELIECLDVNERLEKVLTYLTNDTEIMAAEQRIRQRVKKKVEKSQKEAFLQEQIGAIQKELGGDDSLSDYAEIEKAIKEKNMPKVAKDRVLKELRKWKQMSTQSSEYAVLRNYFDWIVLLPWNKLSEDDFDYEKSLAVLDKHHYGLEKVKERVLEYLSVQKLTGENKGSILCLVGPPGVGKSTLAKSIAEATKRDFTKASLGGLRDEAEIRGHRRTYVGALPGKIISSLKRVNHNNPVFLLDEVDKMTSDSFRGDPAAALLEVLDPAQNNEFMDHYLDLEYDLSKFLFITTANTAQTIPGPLMDRMEVIELSSYTPQEKFHIAKNHLFGKQLKEHGLTNKNVSVTDPTLHMIIENYTRESGVRNLDRTLAKLCRKVATSIVREKASKDTLVKITRANLKNYLGVAKYVEDTYHREPAVGVVNGLAWTSVGGSKLVIEVGKVKGKSRIIFTGRMGDVMTESAKTAMSCVQVLLEEYECKSDVMEKYNYHIHIPEGAVPKDGPSAGITMATAFFSVVADAKIKDTIAMTGEITLKGQVLPIGGLKEKLIAAYKEGVKTVLIPKGNEKDLEEDLIPETEELEIIPVSNIEEVFKHAFVEKMDVIKERLKKTASPAVEK